MKYETNIIKTRKTSTGTMVELSPELRGKVMRYQSMRQIEDGEFKHLPFAIALRELVIKGLAASDEQPTSVKKAPTSAGALHETTMKR